MGIDPKTARACLLNIKDTLAAGSNLDKRYLDAIDMALQAVSPPYGSGHCAWVYLPDKDTMPYSHIKTVTELTSEISMKKMRERAETIKGHEIVKPMSIAISGDQITVVNRALIIYKSILMTVNKEEMKEELKKALEERERKEKEGSEESV